MPVHFLDLASAVEKLRWAEKEWRELDKELAGEAGGTRARAEAAETDESDEVADEESETVLQAAEPA